MKNLKIKKKFCAQKLLPKIEIGGKKEFRIWGGGGYDFPQNIYPCELMNR